MSSEEQPDVPLTEQENPRTRGLSELPTEEIVRLMNEEDARVAGAVRLVLPEVARAVEGIVGRLRAGVAGVAPRAYLTTPALAPAEAAARMAGDHLRLALAG